MNVKKIVAGILACCVVGGALPSVESMTSNTVITVSAVSSTWDETSDTSWYSDDLSTYEISTASQLAGLVELNKSGNTFKGKIIYLLNDIDFSNTSAIDSMNNFMGTIEGNSHSISGLKNPFIETNYGTIKEIDFNSSISFQIPSQKIISKGIVANANSGTISGCNVSGTIISNTPESQSGMHYSAEKVYIGGICGEVISGKIEDCTSSVNITRSTDHRESLMYIGGICGQSTNATITKCSQNGTITANATPLQSKIVVYTSKVVNIDPLSKKIYYDCYPQTDWVDSKQYVGGICGDAQGSDFYSCKNMGSIICTNKIKAGKTPSVTYETDEVVLSYTNEYGNTYYMLKKCYRYNPYKSDETSTIVENRVGGICGSALYYTDFYGCSNSGSGQTNVDSFGKICGYKDENSTINATVPTTTTTMMTTTTMTTTTTINPTTAPTTGSNVKVTLLGDANCDGSVTIADSTAILQYLGNPDKYGLSEQGAKNADCCDTGDGVKTNDALSIQKLDAKVISKLPETTDEK